MQPAVCLLIEVVFAIGLVADVAEGLFALGALEKVQGSFLY